MRGLIRGHVSRYLALPLRTGRSGGRVIQHDPSAIRGGSAGRWKWCRLVSCIDMTVEVNRRREILLARGTT